MKSTRFSRLREQAIAVLGGRLSQNDDAAVLLHEMEVLQTELELQQEELVEAEQRASRLAEYYQQLFLESPLGLVLLDESQQVRECNHRALLLLGLSETLPDALDFERFIAPEDQSRWDTLAERGVAGPSQDELHVRQFGGERRLCSMTLSRHKGGLLLSLDDITQLRAAEANRRFADERLARVLRDSKDGVVFVDAVSGLIAEVNAAFSAALGAPLDQLVGYSLDTLFPPEDLVRQQLAYRQASAQPLEHQTVPFRFKTRSGGLLHTEVAVGRLTEGQRVYVTLLVRDVSARIRIEAEREEMVRSRHQSQKMEALGQLAAGIAHDINNVLTAILACASTPDDASAEEKAEALSEIRQAALRGRDVTGRLGALSRPRPLRPQRFDLLAVLRELHALLRHSLPRTIELLFDTPTGSCFIEGDAGEWHQAFLNLAINARDAMPKGGRLRFSLRSSPPSGAKVVVDDSGTGMTSDVLARAFEPFFTTKPVGVGTGLGLAHVHAVARAHDVTPEVTSVIGQGTTFTFHFPRAQLQVAEPVVTMAKVLRYAGRALVVDDDPAVRRSTARLLGMLGVEVREADCGEQAVEVLEQEAATFSVIVTDLTMPRGDGAQLAKIARERWPSIPVLVVTGDLTESRRAVLEEAQVVGILAKPYSTEELAGLLGPHLPKRPE